MHISTKDTAAKEVDVGARRETGLARPASGPEDRRTKKSARNPKNRREEDVGVPEEEDKSAAGCGLASCGLSHAWV